MKELTFSGRVWIVLLGALEIIFAAVAIYTPYWQVWFTDCSNSDTYYYIVLDDGLCVDGSDDAVSNFDSCTTWKSLDVNSSTASDDAVNFITARKLLTAALSFSVILSGFGVLNFLVPRLRDANFRMIQCFFYLVSLLLVIISFSVTSESFYFNPDNYPESAFCSTQSSLVDGGYAVAVMLLFMLFTSSMAVVGWCNCCNCVDNSDAAVARLNQV